MIDEIDSTMVTFYTWQEWAKSNVPAQADVETANFLKDSFSGFMQGPVGMHQGKTLTAVPRKISVTVDSLMEAKEFFDTLNKENPAFLYTIMYQPARMLYHKIDEQTFEPVKLAVPEMSQALWCIRYATLNPEFS